MTAASAYLEEVSWSGKLKAAQAHSGLQCDCAIRNPVDVSWLPIYSLGRRMGRMFRKIGLIGLTPRLIV